jgi:hypothetical protein
MTRRIEVRVYEANGTTLVGTLASDRGRQMLVDLSGEGDYSLEVRLGHADEAMLTDGRLVRWMLDGSAVWQGLVEERRPVLADPQTRQSGRVVRCQGRGVLALLERAVVYPELGLGRSSPDTRFFNPASADYNASGWANAVALKRQDDPGPVAWRHAPRDWPDPEAWWIWDTDGDIPPVAPGDVWFRKEFTVPTGKSGDYRFFLTADDGFELYVDGNREASEQRAGLWGTTRYVDLLLDEGTHVIAVKAVNFDRQVTATNAAALILSVSDVLVGGQDLGDTIVRTDNTWKMLPYPATEPGMTPGKILHVLLTEAQTNGFLPGLSWDFTATLDSNGNAWPEEIDVSFPVGMSLLDVVRHLVDEHAIDVDMAPTGLTFRAFASKGQDRTGTVSASYGSNISRLAFRKSPPGPNVALSRTAEGRWVERARSSSATTWGRRAVALSLGAAPSSQAADRQADAFFDDNAEPVEEIVDLQLEAVSHTPLVHFATGDTITATSASGSGVACRVHGIRMSEDQAGQPVWNLELVRE